MDFYITGVTGFLGRHIVKYLLNDAVYPVDNIYGMSRRWADQEKMPNDPRLKMITGDVRDRDALERFFNLGTKKNRDVAIIHAAAFKHLGLAQDNPQECYEVNVDGTHNVMLMADRAFTDQVVRMVLISTDKAVQPINVYGQTKALAEQTWLTGPARFNRVVCRFGNIFGSTGSVVQKWGERIEDGRNYFRITNVEMTRYWYRIGEAVDYVLGALAQQTGIMIPILKASTISDLLQAFVNMIPTEQEYKIEKFPLRPGEKLNESMSHAGELMYAKITKVRGLHNVVHLVPNYYNEPQKIDVNLGLAGLLSSNQAEKYSAQALTPLVAEYMRNKEGMAL